MTKSLPGKIDTTKLQVSTRRFQWLFNCGCDQIIRIYHVEWPQAELDKIRHGKPLRCLKHNSPATHLLEDIIYIINPPQQEKETEPDASS